jgi:hypothetical protein
MWLITSAISYLDNVSILINTLNVFDFTVVYIEYEQLSYQYVETLELHMSF